MEDIGLPHHVIDHRHSGACSGMWVTRPPRYDRGEVRRCRSGAISVRGTFEDLTLRPSVDLVRDVFDVM